MPLLSLSNLLISRDGVPVLDIDSLDVREGEVLALIGPNGAGKSTLLLTMALLLRPERGQVLFRGEPVPPARELATRRRMALVLQDPLLLHASVGSNVASGLRYRGMAGAEVDERVGRWLERLGIRHLKDRPARKLSGGEAQRASLARALAIQPDLLLLDEPFSALDAPTRAALLEEMKSLLAETRVTTVFVTHDLDEALLLGDRVAVLIDGRLRQVGPPEKVFSAPEDPEVARFVGVETVIPGRVTGGMDGLVTVDAAGARLQAVGELPAGALVYLCLRPEDVTLRKANGPHPSSARNTLPGTITHVAPQGPLARVVLSCGVGGAAGETFQMAALVTRTSAREMDLSEGQPVEATFKASAVHLIHR